MADKKNNEAADGNSFMLPHWRLSDAFMATRAVPNYKLDNDLKPDELADFRTVLLGLASAETRLWNRNAIFPVDMEEYLESPPPSGERGAFNAIEGKSPVGFHVAVLAASSKKEPVYLYVIEDSIRNKVMVAGTVDAPKDLKEKLAAGGVKYIAKNDPKAAVEINEFLAEGAKYRGEKGMLNVGTTMNVIEDLIRGFSIINEVPLQNNTIERGATLGGLIQKCKPEPVCYTNVMKPKVKWTPK